MAMPEGFPSTPTPTHDNAPWRANHAADPDSAPLGSSIGSTAAVATWSTKRCDRCGELPRPPVPGARLTSPLFSLRFFQGYSRRLLYLKHLGLPFRDEPVQHRQRRLGPTAPPKHEGASPPCRACRGPSIARQTKFQLQSVRQRRNEKAWRTCVGHRQARTQPYHHQAARFAHCKLQPGCQCARMPHPMFVLPPSAT